MNENESMDNKENTGNSEPSPEVSEAMTTEQAALENEAPIDDGAPQAQEPEGVNGAEATEDSVEGETPEMQTESAPVASNGKKDKKEKKDKNKIKKKRGCCFHCCMTLLVFNFVMTCLLISVGWIFGDQLCQQKLGMSLTDTFGVVTGLTHSNDKFIDNRFKAEDEQGFYDALGGALLLKKGVINGDELKETVIDGIKNEDEIGETMLDYAVDNILNKDNLDNQAIKRAEEGEAPRLVITDRELAAFINGIIGSVVDGYVVEMLKEQGLEEYGVDIDKLNIKQYVLIDQIKFSIKDGVNMMRLTASVNFKQMFKDIKKSLDVNVLVKNNIPDAQSYSGLIGFGAKTAINIVKAILPNKLFLTLDMGLSKSVEPAIYINNMGMGNKKMDHLYTLLKTADIDLKAELNDLFAGEDGAIKNAIDDINKVAPLNQILGDGKIDCDVYQFALDLAGVNKDEDGNDKADDERITSNDVFAALGLLLDTESYDERITELKSAKYNYKNVVKDENGNFTLEFLDNAPNQYYVTDGEELDKLMKQYEAALIDKFVSAYGLSRTDEDGKKRTLEDIIEIFTGDDFTVENALKLFAADMLQQVVNGERAGLVLDDRLLGAMFAKMLPSLTEGLFGDGDGGDGDELAPASETEDDKDKGIAIEYISIQEVSDKLNAELKHHMLCAGLNIDIFKLIDNLDVDELIKRIVRNLINEKFIIEVKIDITLKGVGGENEPPYLATEIYLNDRSTKAVDKLISAFADLGRNEDGTKMSLAEFIGKNLSPVHELLDNLSSTLPGVELQANGLKMPDLYEAIAYMLNSSRQEGAEEITDGQVEAALKLLIATDPFKAGAEYAFFADDEASKDKFDKYNKQCGDALIDEITSKYSLKKEIQLGGETHKLTLNDLLVMLKIIDMPEDSPLKDMEVFDLLDSEQLGETAITYNSLNWRDALTVEILNDNSDRNNENGDGDMLTALIREIMFSGQIKFGDMLEGKINNENLLFVNLEEVDGQKFMTIALKLKVTEIMPENEGEDNSVFNFLLDILPDRSSLIELKVDITEYDNIEGKKLSKIIINGNEDGTDSLDKILTAVGLDLDFSEIGTSIRDIVLGLDDTIEGIELKNKKMTLPNIFAVISEIALNTDDNKFEDEDVKTSLAGVYKTSNAIPQGGTQTRRKIFEAGIDSGMTKPVGVEEGEANVVAELKNKYFLDLSDEVDTFDKLFDIVDDDFSADIVRIAPADGEENIDLQDYLAYSNKEIKNGTDNDLTPRINLANLGAIFKDKISGLHEGVDIYALTIKEDENKNKYLIMYVSLSVANLFESNSDDDMSNLLAVDVLYARIETNLNEEKDLDSDHPYYESTISINDMSKAQQDTLMSIINALGGSSGSNESDIDKLAKDVGKGIYEAFNRLSKSYGKGGFDVTTGGIELSDVFTFLGENIIKYEDKETHFDGEQIKAAIQGMYAHVDVTEGNYNNDYNYKYDEVVRNPISGENIELSPGDKPLIDKDLGSILNASYTRNAEEGSVEQLSILSANSTGEKQTKVREFLKQREYGDVVSDDKNYLIVTVYANIDSYVAAKDSDDKMTGNSDELLPEKMYVTFILEFVPETEEFEYKAFMLNGMNRSTCNVLLRLTGLKTATSDPEKNIAGHSNTATVALKEVLQAYAAYLSAQEMIKHGGQGSVTVTHNFIEDTDSSTTVRGKYSCKAEWKA